MLLTLTTHRPKALGPVLRGTAAGAGAHRTTFCSSAELAASPRTEMHCPPPATPLLRTDWHLHWQA